MYILYIILLHNYLWEELRRPLKTKKHDSLESDGKNVAGLIIYQLYTTESNSSRSPRNECFVSSAFLFSLGSQDSCTVCALKPRGSNS